MKANQKGNNLVLTWEKSDNIKAGETITVSLNNGDSTRESINSILNSYTEEGLQAVLGHMTDGGQVGL